MMMKSAAVSRKVEHCKEAQSDDDSFIVKWLRSLKVKKLSELELILFGFAMILGNRSTGWNTGLTHGINAVWFNLFFSASGFFCLCLCMGEMSSALPFSGGVFGFVRAALGPFWGFLVATCEFVYCITAIALKAQRVFSNGSTSKNDSDAGGIILIFGVCLGLNLIGGKPVFALTSVMGLLIASLLFIYLFGTLGNVGSDSINFTHYAPPDVDFTWVHIMSSRSAVGGLFNGMQFFPLLSPYLKEPREQLPRVMLISCTAFLVTTVFNILAAVSRDNGGKKLSSTSTPLQNGFGQIFDMDSKQAQYLDLPFQFSSVFCLFYCAGRQLLAITKSGLLPSFLEKTIPGADTPYYCYTFTAIVGVGLNLFVLYYPEHLAEVKAISSTSSVLIFIFCLIAFMIFRRKFSSMARSFVNPLGDYSAIYGIISFCFATIGLVFYTDVNPLFLVAIGGYLLFSTIFFWTYLVKNQKFSDEEKKIMFKAYLINANRNMRKNRLKNNKIGPCTNSGADNPSNSKCRNSSQGRAGASTIQYNTSIADNVSSTRVICPAKDQKPIEETLLASSSVSRAASMQSSSQSTRQPEPVGSKKMSTKLIAFLSPKMNAVSPLLNQMDSKELQDYEQLAALSAGGIPNDEAEEALETRFGVDENVVERNVEADTPEPDQLVVEEPEMNGN